MNEKTVKYDNPFELFTEKVHGFVDRFQERLTDLDKITGDCSPTVLNQRVLTKVERKMDKIERKMDKFQDYVEKNPMMASLIAYRAEALATRSAGKQAPKVAKGTSSGKQGKKQTSKAA